MSRPRSPLLNITLSEGDKFSQVNAKKTRSVWRAKAQPHHTVAQASPSANDESFNHSTVAKKLRDVKIFENLGSSELDTLAQAMTRVVVPCNEWVFEEGRNGDALFVIKSGTAEVLKYMDDHHEQIAKLQQWSVFGERALIKGELRFAGVRATSDPLTLLTITREGFEKALGTPLREILEEQQYDPAERAARRTRRLEQQKILALQSVANKQKETEKSEKLRKRLERMERRTINPRGHALVRWDKVMLFAMFYTSTFTPFEICFMADTGVGAMKLADWVQFALNRLIDSIFLIDICLTFFVPFRESPRKGGRWVFDSKRIAARYLHSWFALDLITAIPVDFILQFTGLELYLDDGTYTDRIVKRSLKLLRMLKIVRLIRLSRIMKRMLARSDADPSLLELIKFLFMTLIMAHWLACVWGFEGLNYNDGKPVDIYDWPEQAYTWTWIQRNHMTNASPLQLYSAALYVALSNIFGGPTEISPANYLEFLLQGLMMFFGSSLWAYIIGCGCSILASLNPAADEHRRSIAMLNHFCRDHSVPIELTARLRSYFNETNRWRYYDSQSQDLLKEMTAKLRGEASLAASTELFAQVPYFNDKRIEPTFLSRAALLLFPLVLVPRENVGSDCLTIVFSGLIAKDGVCGIRCFGDDIVLNNESIRHSGRGMALTLVQLQRMTREALDSLLAAGQCPQAQICVREWVVRTTMQRVILATARWAQENSVDAGDEPNLQECFQKMKKSKEWMSGSSSAPEEYTVGKSPLEMQVDGMGASVAELSKRMDDLGGTMRHALEELVAIRERTKRSHVRKANRMIMLEATERITSPNDSPDRGATDQQASEIRCCKSRPSERPLKRRHTRNVSKETPLRPLASDDFSA